jgi:PAS domain S-box-containing protein
LIINNFVHGRNCKGAESMSWYQALFDDNEFVLLVIDPESGAIIDANKAACAYYGYAQGELTSFTIDRINTAPLVEILKALRRSLKEGGLTFVFRHRLANGDIKLVTAATGPISTGGATFLYSLVQESPNNGDLVDQAAKEILIRELDHQVRNNLQFIESMISLKIGEERGETRPPGLGQLRNKIQIISSVYDMALGSGSDGFVPAEPFLRSIVANSRSAHTETRADIVIRCEEELAFRLDQAVSVGLVVDSSLEAAFARSDASTPLHIEVGAERGEAGVELRVGDDSSLGDRKDLIETRIAQAAASQLGAELEIRDLLSGGFSVRCSFPVIGVDNKERDFEKERKD